MKKYLFLQYLQKDWNQIKAIKVWLGMAFKHKTLEAIILKIFMKLNPIFTTFKWI